MVKRRAGFNSAISQRVVPDQGTGTAQEDGLPDRNRKPNSVTRASGPEAHSLQGQALRALIQSDSEYLGGITPSPRPFPHPLS